MQALLFKVLPSDYAPQPLSILLCATPSISTCLTHPTLYSTNHALPPILKRLLVLFQDVVHPNSSVDGEIEIGEKAKRSAMKDAFSSSPTLNWVTPRLRAPRLRTGSPISPDS